MAECLAPGVTPEDTRQPPAIHGLRLDTDRFFNRCVFVDPVGRFSVDYLWLARQQSALTFDERFLDSRFRPRTETPFRQIRLAHPREYCPARIPVPEPIFDGSYEAYLHEIEQALRRVLLRMDPHRPHIFSHSSGADSRIISGTMAAMRREGLCSFDNVQFYCWGRHEAEGFRELMARQGWTRLSVLDDSRPNAYDVGRLDESVEGWNPYTYQIRFWGDLDPSRYVLISGAEEVLSESFDQWIHTRRFFSNRGESVHRMARLFGGTCFPLFSHELLALTARMPSAWRDATDPRLGRDKLRTDLVERMDLVDIPAGQLDYSFNLTSERITSMVDAYEASRFKRRYRASLDPDDLLARRTGWNSCLWGFAVTVYEQLC